VPTTFIRECDFDGCISTARLPRQDSAFSKLIPATFIGTQGLHRSDLWYNKGYQVARPSSPQPRSSTRFSHRHRNSIGFQRCLRPPTATQR
jgi:hypothetical protein